MIVTTLCEVPGKRIREVKGIVTSNTVMARHLGKDIVASMRGIVGGEIREYEELLSAAREKALDELVRKAREMGANAVLCVRFATSQVAPRMAEILVYGTAAVVED